MIITYVLILVACVLIGIGLGMVFGKTIGDIIIGAGLGFIAGGLTILLL
jgi:hypothetical protein